MPSFIAAHDGQALLGDARGDVRLRPAARLNPTLREVAQMRGILTSSGIWALREALTAAPSRGKDRGGGRTGAPTAPDVPPKNQPESNKEMDLMPPRRKIEPGPQEGGGGGAAARPRPARRDVPRSAGSWLVGMGALIATVAGLLGLAGPASAGVTSSAPLVGIANTADGHGYWIAASDGGVFSFGDAAFYGSMGGKQLSASVVGIARTADGKGYWLVAADGGVFSFGDAGFYGSMAGKPLSAPVVGMAATPDGKGYRLVAADGGVFSFGDAGFYGSMGGQHLDAAIVGIAGTPDGKGYWLTAGDGGVFAFGDAPFHGSLATSKLVSPVVGIAGSPGGGYWLVAADGGVFTFGNAGFYGSMGGHPLNAPVLGMSPMPAGIGYRLLAHDGGLFDFGTAGYLGSVAYTAPAPTSVVTPAELTLLFGVPASVSTPGLASLNTAMAQGAINTAPRISAFLAQVYAESTFIYWRVETRCNPLSMDLSCGRGYLQLTNEYNYQAAGNYFGQPFVSNPLLTISLTYSAPIARWFWTVSHNLNALADQLNINAITKAVNGTGAKDSTLRQRCGLFNIALGYYHVAQVACS